MHQSLFFFSVLLALVCCTSCKTSSNLPKQSATHGDYYELRTYHLQNKTQEQSVDNYLQQAFLPGLHRAGWTNIGVFKPIDSDTANFGKRIFVLLTAPSLEALAQVPQLLQNDAAYATAAKDYQDATNDLPPYERLEISWLSAFSGHLHLKKPYLHAAKTERVYEIRSYESATEKLHANKVQMFNAANEIGLFESLGFNAAFYSAAITGAHMPNLVYMICFDNMASHDAHWKTFRDSPKWKEMTALPAYKAKNVSHIDSYLLHPAAYSDY